MTAQEVNIALCGGAGQGIQTVESILTELIKRSGYNVFSTKEYMSRVRGGLNSTTIRVSPEPVRAMNGKVDILLALAPGAVEHMGHRVGSDTKIIGDDVGDIKGAIVTGLADEAIKLGSPIYSNIIAASALARVLGIEREDVDDLVGTRFEGKGKAVVEANINAITAGYALGEELVSKGISYRFETDSKVKGQLLLNGSQAIAYGAMAAGCDFISAYPMSPSTGVLIHLAAQSHRFGIAVEQAEDEISAINMCLGASYAGARALASTSGGGFALMEEGISLAGITETPIVVHIAQRPGPATGLPTRTGQEDLELALHAGHGEFPRIIYAPGTLDDAFEAVGAAFNNAEKHQVPAFVLTDQYLMDSYHNIGRWDLKPQTIENHLIKTTPGYKRYEQTESGVSPRGVPGYGTGLVYADSDEHDVEGRITESAKVRDEMVEKRLRKARGIRKDVMEPVVDGELDAKLLVVCWGSTYPAALEASRSLGPTVSIVYFKQVYPLPEDAMKYLGSAKRTLIVEGNATSQFGRLIRAETGHVFDHKVLKYDGHPFTADMLKLKLMEAI